MKRIFLTVLDACGVGELPDAADYGDVGACTIGHAVDACHPSLPNMAHMGLGQIVGAHYPADENAVGAFGMCREASKGKDTTTGHWEIAGVTLAKPFPTFPTASRRILSRRSSSASGIRSSATSPRLARRFWTNWARSIWRSARRLSTPPPTACSRLPATRRFSPARSCTRCAALPARCSRVICASGA